MQKIDLVSPLPFEVLLLIFEEATRAATPQNFSVDLHSLASFCCVSKRWNTVGMTPSLWSTICVTPTESPSIDICIRRSRRSPLTIAVEYGYDSTADGRATLLSTFSRLHEHIGRWRFLRISARRQYLRGLLSLLECASAPRLEHLQLAQNETKFSPVDIGPLFNIFMGGLPSLKSLRTFGFIPVTKESFERPSLSRLETVRALNHPCEWGQFYDFLAAPRNLTHLAISTGRVGLVPNTTYPIIDLPNLRSLCLTYGSSDTQSTILNILDAPNLERLEVSWISDWDVFLHSLESLCECHPTRFPHVTTLIFHKIVYTPTFEDYRLFEAFPNLKCLVLDAVQDVETFYEAIDSLWEDDVSGDRSYPWPKLEGILVTGNDVSQDVASYIPTKRPISGQALGT
ncbi:hypothetical protein PLEOSDRAFT_1102652 [Pleurotus ostreatus PC15]|uniref:F-box domain-containing protein n=1 Tax=Pleurotus ostreatus (strain PC15) TaxID=1137138 RepID=A0A067NNM5_PLEO1|nr:hypothetical protein PLEOSDRAFT_1102652 [Pleurotus ostreatus PC15]